MDLIRILMLKLEAVPVNGHTIWRIGPGDEELVIEGASFDQVAYHLRLIKDEGYLDSPGGFFSTGQIQFRGLTWAGHDFIDSVRDYAVWRKTKEQASKVKSWTVDLLVSLAKAYAKAKIKEHTGFDL